MTSKHSGQLTPWVVLEPDLGLLSYPHAGGFRESGHQWRKPFPRFGVIPSCTSP